MNPAKGASRDNNFNLLRLLAAMEVIVVHSVEHFHLPVGAGLISALFTGMCLFPGVPVFFAISGFLIPPSWERKPTLRDYARKRILRIYPALWAAFLVSAVLIVCLHGIRPSQIVSAPFAKWVVAQVTFAQYWTPDLLRSYGVGAPNGSLWTIPVELEFYVAVPVLWLVQRRVPARTFDAVLIGLTLLSFGLNALVTSTPKGVMRFVDVTFAPHIWLFFVGWLMSRNWGRIRPALENRGLWWTVGYAVFLLAVNQLHSWTLGLAASVLLAPVAVSLAYTVPGLTKKLLGDMDISYGAYLYHMIVINALIQLGYRGVGYPVLLVIAITLVLASASWFGLERYALKLKDRIPVAARVRQSGGQGVNPGIGDQDDKSAVPAPSVPQSGGQGVNPGIGDQDDKSAVPAPSVRQSGGQGVNPGNGDQDDKSAVPAPSVPQSGGQGVNPGNGDQDDKSAVPAPSVPQSGGQGVNPGIGGTTEDSGAVSAEDEG